MMVKGIQSEATVNMGVRLKWRANLPSAARAVNGHAA